MKTKMGRKRTQLANLRTERSLDAKAVRAILKLGYKSSERYLQKGQGGLNLSRKVDRGRGQRKRGTLSKKKKKKKSRAATRSAHSTPEGKGRRGTNQGKGATLGGG